MDRRASTLSAGAMFFFSIVGQLLLIVSMFVAMGGLLMVTGTLGHGWEQRIIGIGLVVAATGGFLGGTWATSQFAVQRKS